MDDTARLFKIICRALHSPCRISVLSSEKRCFDDKAFVFSDNIGDSDIVVIDNRVLYHDLLINILAGTGQDTLVAISHVFDKMDFLPRIMYLARTHYYTVSILPIDNGLLLMMKSIIPREAMAMLERSYRESVLHSTYSVSYNTGRLLYLIARFVGLKRKTCILEIGAGTGFSTLWLGLAAQHSGSKLVSYEKNPDLAGLAQTYIRSSRLKDSAKVIASDPSKGVESNDYFFVFINADKHEYSKYLEIISPTIERAVIASHNIISHPVELRNYIEKIYKEHETITLMSDSGGVALTLYP